MDIFKAFKSLCRLAKRYELAQKAFNSSNGEGALVVQYLEEIANYLKEKKMLGDNNLELRVSKGRGSVPKIFWIAALPTGFSPAGSLSVTICFGKNGDGFVAGLMVPKMGAFHDLETAPRVGPGFIDIDSRKDTSKYNNCYINPLDILVDDFSEIKLINHLKDSIELLNDQVKLGKNSYKNLYAR